MQSHGTDTNITLNKLLSLYPGKNIKNIFNYIATSAPQGWNIRCNKSNEIVHAWIVSVETLAVKVLIIGDENQLKTTTNKAVLSSSRNTPESFKKNFYTILKHHSTCLSK